MSGEIKHEWSGSILTITSASGSSSADLKGPKGDTGPRGPQGPAGILVDKDGEVKVDLSPYYTAEEVDAKLENVSIDLSGYATKAYVIEKVDDAIPNMSDYATKNYVSTEIAKAQLSGGGGTGEVDLSGYATKDDLKNISVEIDNKTIIRDENGKLKTALGGAEYVTGNLIFESYASTWVLDSGNTGGMNSGDYIIGSSTYNFENNKSYFVVITWADGDQSKVYYTNDDMGYGDCLSYEFRVGDPGFSNTTISRFWVYTNKTTDNVYFYKQSNTKDDFIHIAIYDGETDVVVEPINAKFVPVDGTTIIINDDGKLTAISGGTSLGDYYTKSEIDALLAQIETYPSAEEVEY